MSYILDALRRADAERERGSVPGLHAQPMAGASLPALRGGTAARWWIALAVLAVLLAVLSTALLLRRPEPAQVLASDAAVPAAGTSTATAPPAFTVPPLPAPAARPAEPVPQTARQARPAARPAANGGIPASAAAAPGTAAPLRLDPQSAATATPSAIGTTTTTTTAAPAVAETRIPELKDLPEELRRQLPVLTIGGASYSANAASRMLIINGQVFHEKDPIGPDHVLEQISLKSAVLRFRGTRYSIAFDVAMDAPMRVRLTLQTLTRGDGLLGMKPEGVFGPRGVPLTVARIEFVYADGGGRHWLRPMPRSVLEARMQAQFTPTWVQRDRSAEHDASDAVRASGLHPISPAALQWRSAEAGAPHRALWSLAQEDFFGEFWAGRVPALQALGWQIVVQPGFAHLSVPVDAWRLVVSPADGEDVPQELGLEPAGPLPAPVAGVTRLRQPAREGAWLLSLGIEVEGESLDLAPLIADLLKRDGRWLDAAAIAAIEDDAVVLLHAPGGRQIMARAAPLKAIVGAMVELLTDPLRRDGPLRLSVWDAGRLEALRQNLSATQAARAGEHGAWQLQGDAGLRLLAERLRGAELAAEPAATALPTGLGITLRPYQALGVQWLQTLRAQDLGGILADDMGLGKTAQALAHVLIEQQAGRLSEPALVLMPTTLLFNWQAEARRVAPALRVLTWHGPDRGGDVEAFADADLVLSTYTLAWRDIERLQRQRFHLLILDEAQTVKNAAGRAADAVRRLNARHRLCLTGTPLENHLGELWAQFDFLMPGFLGDARSFHRRWRKPIEENGETLRARLLAQRVRPFILRRRKDEVATELPPKSEFIERLPLRGLQRDLYESVRVAADKQVRRALERSGFKGAQIAVLDALLKLRQVCCDPHLVKGRRTPPQMERAKVEWLRQALPELVGEGRRVLVFSQFTEMLDLIDAELVALGVPALMLTGRTPSAERGPTVAQFQSGSHAVFLISLKAGGLGLNLTAADTVIHVDPWWNPAVEQQATDRAHRIGQSKPVFVYKLVAAGSIEERILELQARKRALADAVLGRDAGAAPKFSESELEGLLAPLDDAG